MKIFKKLKEVKLAIKNAKGEQARSISLQLPREHKSKGREFYDGTFVTIIGACENGLEQEHSEFGSIFLSLALWLRTRGIKHTEGTTSQMEKSVW